MLQLMGTQTGANYRVIDLHGLNCLLEVTLISEMEATNLIMCKEISTIRRINMKS